MIENAITKVFVHRRVLWATLGGALAVWQVSGAVRAVMGALARIYEAPTERPFLRPMSRALGSKSISLPKPRESTAKTEDLRRGEPKPEPHRIAGTSWR